jgi:hypothetical protein
MEHLATIQTWIFPVWLAVPLVVLGIAFIILYPLHVRPRSQPIRGGYFHDRAAVDWALDQAC